MTEAPEHREPSKKEDLINGFNEARRVVFQSLIGLDRDDFERPINDSGTTIRNMLAHWIEWDKFEIERVGKYLSGKEVDMRPDEDNDAFNKQAFEKWQNASIGQLMVEFMSSTDDVSLFLESLSEEELFSDEGFRFTRSSEGGDVKDIINPAWMLVENDHDVAHAKEIEDWKKEVGIGGYLQIT